MFDVLLNTTIMMSCITPFISEYIYQNLKNGITEQQAKQYFADSIHFLNIPDYDEHLINERIEEMVQRMQSTIELGRKVRENKNRSLKTPVSKVTVVTADPQAAEDYKTL